MHSSATLLCSGSHLLSKRSLQLSHILVSHNRIIFKQKVKTAPQSVWHNQVWLCCPIAERTAVDVAYHSWCLLGRKQERTTSCLFTPLLGGITHINNVREFYVCTCALNTYTHREYLICLGHSNLAQANTNTHEKGKITRVWWPAHDVKKARSHMYRHSRTPTFPPWRAVLKFCQVLGRSNTNSIQFK